VGSRRGHEAANRPADAARQHEPVGPAALRELLGQSQQLAEYFLHYVSARADILKRSVRVRLIWALAGLLGLFAMCVTIAIALHRIVLGLANGLGALLGGRVWLGDLAAGALLLASVALLFYLAQARWNNAFHQKMVVKYEKRKARQQTRFGHRASDSATHSQQLQD
jgi:hypothetical protein